MKNFQGPNHNQESTHGYLRPAQVENQEKAKAVCEECGTIELNRTKTFCAKDGHALFWERISDKQIKARQKQVMAEIKKRNKNG